MESSDDAKRQRDYREAVEKAKVGGGGRLAVKSVETESEADAQKRRDRANESPIDKELREKREAKDAAAKAVVESPVVLKSKQ